MKRWGALGFVVIVAALVSSRCGARLAPDLLFDGTSYVAMAEQIAATRRIPALETRPPLYPLLIAALGALQRGAFLQRLVDLQWLAWIACAALVYLIVLAATSSAVAGLVAGLLFCSLPGSLFYVHRIYPETFATLAMLAALLAFVLAEDAHGRRALLLTTLAAALALAAAHLRPILQLLPVLLAALIVLDRRRRVAVRLALAAPFALALLIGLLPWYVLHAQTRGGAYFVKTASYTVANYLGDRRLLGRFPARDRAIEEVYRRQLDARPDQAYVSWWEASEGWTAAAAPHVGDDFDRLHLYMGQVARRVLLANPDVYLARWREAWIEFSSALEQLAQADGCPIAPARPLWAGAWPLLGWWLPFVVLGVELVQWTRHGRDASTVALAPIAIYVAIGLANTALEPWTGQARYRAPIEGLLVIALVSMSARISTAARARS